MSTIDDLRRQILALPANEMADLAQWLSRQATAQRTEVPGITRTPGVCGGDACIAGTRIPVWLIEQSRRMGLGPDRLLTDYPHLSRVELERAWEYARLNKAEIDQQIADQEAA